MKAKLKTIRPSGRLIYDYSSIINSDNYKRHIKALRKGRPIPLRSIIVLLLKTLDDIAKGQIPNRHGDAPDTGAAYKGMAKEAVDKYKRATRRSKRV